MHPHHAASIANTVAHFEAQPDVRALLLGGSLAHGYATAASDVDILILVDDAAHAARRAAHALQFYSEELCTYPGGYVDGKVLPVSFLGGVAATGSEPARFAFQDARILIDRLPGLEAALRAIVSYPTADKRDRIRRFYAQFEAWHWYAHEALRLDNRYLLGVAVSKLVLFGGRLVLAHNELLYPYHKWFLRVLADAPERPSDLMDRIAGLYDAPTAEHVRAFYETVRSFRAWETDGTPWPSQFMVDSELTWLTGCTPVDDL